jgi:hypothetical protein
MMTPRALGDAAHGGMELAAAVAAARAEDVAGQALAVHAHEGRGFRVDLAHDQRDMVHAVEVNVEVQAEGAELGRHVDVLDLLDQLLAAPAMGDEVGDAADLEVVLAGKF